MTEITAAIRSRVLRSLMDSRARIVKTIVQRDDSASYLMLAAMLDKENRVSVISDQNVEHKVLLADVGMTDRLMFRAAVLTYMSDKLDHALNVSGIGESRYSFYLGFLNFDGPDGLKLYYKTGPGLYRELSADALDAEGIKLKAIANRFESVWHTATSNPDDLGDDRSPVLDQNRRPVSRTEDFTSACKLSPYGVYLLAKGRKNRIVENFLAWRNVHTA